MFEDKSVQEDVMRELDWEPAVHSTEIGVAVKDGIVMLSGTVGSYAVKRAVEHAATRVRGVKAVSSQIEVKPTGAGARSDADIAWAAANTLAWNALVPSGRVTVSVTNGWITLEGVVERRFQRDAAEDAVWGLAGVVGVTNLITLCAAVPAQELKDEIESALARCAGVNPRPGRISSPASAEPATASAEAISAGPASTAALARNQAGRLGIAVSDSVIIPVLYSLPTASTPATAATAWLR